MAPRPRNKVRRTPPDDDVGWTMADVARAAGVSAMTVSRALRGDGLVARDTRRRVLDAVERLGYVPDLIAGGLSSKRSGFVAALVPSLNNPHFAETAAGLQDTLIPAGLQVLLGHTGYRVLQEERLIETMLRRRPEAIVLTCDGHTPRTRRLLENARIPVVEIWETPRRPIGHVVGFSNRRSAAAMTRHLIAMGRRHIAFIGESDDKGTRGAERRKGFVDALLAAGLDATRQIAFAPPPINMLHGDGSLAALIERWPDTDAVMCVSDPCAFGVLSACQRTGIAVPERIAIAGFGDFEISRCAVPAISTVSVSGLEIGARAGALVVSLLRGSDPALRAPFQTIVVAASPVLRESAP